MEERGVGLVVEREQSSMQKQHVADSREGPLEETVTTLAELMTPLTVIQPFVGLPGERRHLAGQTSCLDLLEFREKIVRD